MKTEDLVPLGLFGIVFVFTFCYLKLRGFIFTKTYPDGPWGFPIVGHLPWLGNDTRKIFAAWQKRYGDVFKIRLGSWPTVVVNGHKAIHEAAVTAGDAFSGRPNFVTTEILRSRTGDDPFAFGTFSPAYLHQKKITTHALRLFTKDRKEFVEELITSEVETLTTNIVKKFSNQSGSVADDVYFAVVSVIYHILYGKDKEVDTDKHVRVLADTLTKFDELSKSGNPIDVMPWLAYVMPKKIKDFKVMMHMFDDVAMSQVAEHYESRLNGNVRDVADSLIVAADELKDTGDSCYELTKGRLFNVLYDLQGGGVDTTSKTILWLILYMAKYPAVQKRVQEELECTVDSTNMPCLDDKPHLTYTNAVIHEVMRIETIIPTSLPHYAMKDSFIRGKKVDKDTVVLFNLYSLAHDPTVWGDPTNFRPDRFLKEDGGLDIKMITKSHPFSLGRRRCIGEQLAIMNIFLIFSGLMKKCTFELYGNPEVATIPGLVYAPEKFSVYVKSRA